MEFKTTEDILNHIISNNTFTIVGKEKLFKEMANLNMELNHDSRNNFYYDFIGFIDNIAYELAFSSLPSSNTYYLSSKRTGFLKDNSESNIEKKELLRKWVTPNCFNDTPSYHSYDYDLELSSYSYHKDGKLFREENRIEDFRKKDDKKAYYYSENEKDINTQCVVFEKEILSYGRFIVFGKTISLNEILNIIPRLKLFNENNFENLKQKLTPEEITSLGLSYN